MCLDSVQKWTNICCEKVHFLFIQKSKLKLTKLKEVISDRCKMFTIFFPKGDFIS